MRKAFAALIGVVAIAAIVPIGAQARGGDPDPVSVRLELPVIFTPPTSLCPEGRAHYGISSSGQSGQGVNCIESVTPVACPDFCQEADAFMKLTLPVGRINGPVTLHETFTCNDPFCLTVTVAQAWEGSVTHATGAYRRLTGAPVSGGGTAVLDGATFEFVSLDEELVIG
jgi:hypothetical protein